MRPPKMIRSVGRHVWPTHWLCDGPRTRIPLTVPRAFLNGTAENEVPDPGNFGHLWTLTWAKLGWIAKQEALVGGYRCALLERFSAVSQRRNLKFLNFRKFKKSR